MEHYRNMHHRMSPSKTGWPSLNVVTILHVLRLVMDDPNSYHPGDYWWNSRAILGRPRISAKSVTEQLDISRERVGSIVHEDLDMWQLSAKWVPKCLNADQKRQSSQNSEQYLEYSPRGPNNFLSRWVTINETWLYHYDPETKQQ